MNTRPNLFCKVEFDSRFALTINLPSQLPIKIICITFFLRAENYKHVIFKLDLEFQVCSGKLESETRNSKFWWIVLTGVKIKHTHILIMLRSF